MCFLTQTLSSVFFSSGFSRYSVKLSWEEQPRERKPSFFSAKLGTCVFNTQICLLCIAGIKINIKGIFFLKLNLLHFSLLFKFLQSFYFLFTRYFVFHYFYHLPEYLMNPHNSCVLFLLVSISVYARFFYSCYNFFSLCVYRSGK